MNEQLTGLQMAVRLLAQIGDEQSDAAIAAVHDLAEEHAKRLTLQLHAADQAQRIADLEAKCVTLKELHDAAADKRDELLVALHGIGKALGIPEGERSPYSITCGTLERVNRLAEIEAQEPVAPTVAPREPSQTAGMSIEQRILHVGGRNNSAGYVEFGGVQAVEALVRQVLRDAKTNYASLVPAQAVPDGWRLVPKKLTKEMRSALVKAAREYMQEYGGNSPEVMYEAAVFAAPEHKA